MDGITPWLTAVMLAFFGWLQFEIRGLRRDLTSLINKNEKQFNDRADKLEKRMDDFAKEVSKRFDEVGQRFDKVGQRFDDVNRELAGQHASITKLEGSLEILLAILRDRNRDAA